MAIFNSYVSHYQRVGLFFGQVSCADGLAWSSGQRVARWGESFLNGLSMQKELCSNYFQNRMKESKKLQKFVYTLEVV
jgi:hypothetical protein